MPPTSANRSAGTLRTTSTGRKPDRCTELPLAAKVLFGFGFDKKILRNDAIQPMGVSPKPKIQSAVSAGDSLLVLRTGSHTSKISRPKAIELATANFKSFFNNAGAFRSGPRKRPINTSAPSHSTGVLSNHP